MTVYAITGANRGLGFQYTKEILKTGPHDKVIAFARNPDSAKDLQQLAASNKDRLAIVKLDVADDASVQEGIKAVRNLDIAKDGIDVLINNAGVLKSWGDAEHLSIKDTSDEFNVNILGVLRVTQGLLDLLREGKEKKIFTLGSIGGSFSADFAKTPMVASYGSSKAYLHFLTLKLSNHLAPEGFTVASIHPGAVATDMLGDAELPDVIQPQEAGEKGVKVFKKLGAQDTGKLWSYTGELLQY